MPAPLKEEKELARQAWVKLPPDKRSAEDVRAAMKKAGVEKVPSKGSINRWVPEWEASAKNTAEVLLPATPEQIMAANEQDFSDIPEHLRDVLSPRLLFVAKGQGLDKVEDAIGALAQAIASKAPEIAQMLCDTETETEVVSKDDDGETKKTVEKAKVARSAVTALQQLAQAMQTIKTARTMVSLAHRNYGEGDRFVAEAHAIHESGRVDRAKIINGKPASAGGMSAVEEAKAALSAEDD